MRDDGSNYRQTGRAPTASSAAVAHAKPPSRPTVASIPSRFETVLQPAAAVSEPRAFGSTRYRFDAHSTPDAPGPGTYHLAHEFERQSTSYSQRGFGNGFVSKARRSIEPYGKPQAPAPGTYNLDASLQIERQRRFAQPSAGFAPRLVDVPDKEPGPGPGQYNPLVTQTVEYLKRLQMPSCAFRSGTQRFRAPAVAVNPGPGQYEAPSSLRSAHGLSAAFRPPTRVAPPAAQSLDAEALARISPTAGDERRRASSAPGPGAYHIDRGIAHNTQLVDPRPSSMFRPSKTDRFGHMTRPVREPEEAPGPGSYYPQPVGEVGRRYRHLVRSSAFVSNSRRGQSLEAASGKVPAPTDYKPRLPAHRSFHLNTTGAWV